MHSSLGFYGGVASRTLTQLMRLILVLQLYTYKTYKACYLQINATATTTPTTPPVIALVSEYEVVATA